MIVTILDTLKRVPYFRAPHALWPWILKDEIKEHNMFTNFIQLTTLWRSIHFTVTSMYQYCMWQTPRVQVSRRLNSRGKYAMIQIVEMRTFEENLHRSLQGPAWCITCGRNNSFEIINRSKAFSVCLQQGSK